MLDDLLIGDGGLVPYGREAATHALMGRFGNALLVNGAEDWRFQARPGEPVRLHLTNAASARTFNLSIDGRALACDCRGCGTVRHGLARSRAWSLRQPSDTWWRPNSPGRVPMRC